MIAFCQVLEEVLRWDFGWVSYPVLDWVLSHAFGSLSVWILS